MERQTGTLHIARNFHTEENQGVYDVMFTWDGPQGDPKRPVLRRFMSDQELADWLMKHVRRDPREVRTIMRRFQSERHAHIHGLRMSEEELRELKLAA
jgi:hypothetical protein